METQKCNIAPFNKVEQVLISKLTIYYHGHLNLVSIIQEHLSQLNSHFYWRHISIVYEWQSRH